MKGRDMLALISFVYIVGVLPVLLSVTCAEPSYSVWLGISLVNYWLLYGLCMVATVDQRAADRSE